MKKCPAVYILADKPNGMIYTGVTNDLCKCVWQHKNDEADTFTRHYGVHQLVYFEEFDDMDEAIKREKTIKKMKRSTKMSLIEENNPNWYDLYDGLI